jgi:cobalamin transport system permease protein
MKRARTAVLATFAMLLVAMVLGVAFGTDAFSLARAIEDPGSLDRQAILVARLPRVVLGAVAGGGLAVVGAAFQAVLRNPLAEPYVLGVSGGAALGATLAITAGVASLAATLGVSPELPLALAAFAGGVGATLLVHALARTRGSASGTTILLAGVVVNAIAAGAITFLKTLVTAGKAQELLFWLVGFLDVESWTAIAIVGAFVAGGAALLLLDAGRLNLLSLGDEGASHLGVDVRRLERRTLLACAAVVGAVASVTGFIGFVGLVVPHAVRRTVGPDARVLLPASVFAGGATLVACDLASRLMFRWVGREPPVGAVTALLGGPVFLALLWKRSA